MRVLLGLVLMLIVSGCGGSVVPEPTVGALPPPPPVIVGKPYVLSVDEHKILLRDLRVGLKDPASAQFGDHSAVKDFEGKVTVCGYLNAKNSYGGYTGAKLYIGYFDRTGKFTLDGSGGDALVQQVITEFCSKTGIDTAVLSPVKLEAMR